MPDYVIEPPVRPALPVEGQEGLFPIRRIYCIGRNYAEHTIEMGGNPDREAPFFFQKNAECAVTDGQFPYPPESRDVHHEVEMVVALAHGGSNISTADALDHVFGYGVGIDMTRRDLQAVAKEQRRPWEPGKAFEKSAPMGALVPASDIGHPAEGEVSLSINGDLRQRGDLSQMIWKTPEIIAYLSRYYDIAGGDLIMTGTPAGVGPVQIGDQITATVEGIGGIRIDVI